jgi:hypothetical protein
MSMPRRLELILVTMLSSAAVHAQPAPDLPQSSPHARVEQRVGITDLAIDYSSPAVKGRRIWGELIPYDKVWRAGANQATKLTASHELRFGGVVVKPGTYAVFVTPGKASWTVVLNTDTTAAEWTYDPHKDIAKITMSPSVLPAPRERLLWYFTDTGDSTTSLDLEWERSRIRIPITVDTRTAALAAIDQATGDAWRAHFASASYLFDAGEIDRALALVDKSIAIQSTWRNEWLRARIEAHKGNLAEARAAATRAQLLGKGDIIYERVQKPNIAKAIAGWN